MVGKAAANNIMRGLFLETAASLCHGICLDRGHFPKPAQIVRFRRASITGLGAHQAPDLTELGNMYRIERPLRNVHPDLLIPQ